jgi:hypothetical protein
MALSPLNLFATPCTSLIVDGEQGVLLSGDFRKRPFTPGSGSEPPAGDRCNNATAGWVACCIFAGEQ